jgi:nicotinate phosphoribosyltransferase
MKLDPLLVAPEDLGLATDLYQLTMMAAYQARASAGTTTFELFVRRLPRGRAFLVAAGLEQALAYLREVRFSQEQIAYLRAHPVFQSIDPSFFEWLARFRFTGDVDAVPEGTVVFPNEPILRIHGHISEAQLVETYLLATINAHTLIASKAARVRIAAGDKHVVDFGARRAHGYGAALLATRSSWIAGLDGTSNVLAAQKLGIPVVGTAAHAFIMSFASEEEAFAFYHRMYPEHCILLIDTYDTLEGCRRATKIGPSLRGVRIDSGDLGELARGCRKILDEAGLKDTKIVASGDLNEDKISALLEEGAPIDSFGVGTELVTSRDQPALGGVYKLVEREEDGAKVPVMKLSEGKVTWPGVKQVFRYVAGGTFARDVIDLEGEEHRGATPLLVPMMRAGEVVAGSDDLSLEAARQRCARQLASLPAGLRKLHGFEEPPVEIGPALRGLAESIREKG